MVPWSRTITQKGDHEKQLERRHDQRGKKTPIRMKKTIDESLWVQDRVRFNPKLAAAAAAANLFRTLDWRTSTVISQGTSPDPDEDRERRKSRRIEGDEGR